MLCMVFATKILQLKKQKNILLCAYWPLSAALLSSKAANHKEDKIRFFFFVAIIRTLSVQWKLTKLSEVKTDLPTPAGGIGVRWPKGIIHQ